MADDLPDMTLQRIVVRTGLSHDLATALLRDIDSKVAFLDALDGPMPRGREPDRTSITEPSRVTVTVAIPISGRYSIASRICDMQLHDVIPDAPTTTEAASALFDSLDAVDP